MLHTVGKVTATYCGKGHCYILWEGDLLHTVGKVTATYCGKGHCYIL